MPVRYECWGSDKQDFTEMLRQAYDRGDIPIFFSEGGEESWSYKMTCREGHENEFEGSARP